MNPNTNIIKAWAEKFCLGTYDYKIPDHLWRNIFEYILENQFSIEYDTEAIHLAWTVNGGHIRRKANNDELLLSFLIRYLPGYSGEGLTVYRGECRFLFDQNKIGFCWTPNIETAKMFARGLNAIESGGVLLKAYAPTESVLATPNKHSAIQKREFEYTCNPKLLEEIELIESFEKRSD